ncbi:MAG: chromosome segregation protein SMC [Gammaproteobacteria bacterium]|nr:chromosome segregation protein SMC [Gammaproteobacteria bacterium]MDH3412283.1 chromosome segregation protein SMC [Gammaproteobacteria bacterium]
MRLRKIRLAGFKSFVDPTTISFPGDLIGVVGPNGCGKSNIIDAVRWVMGEISAKHLRGDTMADVVFTGSTSRKPVGQATVELVFDNSDGRVGGRFASYTEIAVKRQVSLDAQSLYFLNGARCRRRDVMDLFFGTGLGPRSYAIIEQGMISRVIEARPEELRDFLEEAAGISRYKERRRETELRMRHTQENMDRLTDLREELGKRITHLKRQATMAEKYKVLKQEERQLKAELLALQWRALDEEAKVHASEVGEQQVKLEAAIAEQRRAESKLETQRQAHAEATDAFNEVYRKVLDASAAIARSEEAIQSLRSQRQQLNESRERESQNLDEARGHIATEEARLTELRQTLEALEPELEEVQSESARARLEFRQSEEAMHAWQSEFEALSQAAQEPAHAKHAEEARIVHLEENLQQMMERAARIEVERKALDIEFLDRSVREIRTRLDGAKERTHQVESDLEARRESLKTLRQRRHEAAEALHEARDRLQDVRGRLVSLQALQQDALGKGPGGASDWLNARGLAESPRLAEVLKAESGWERAVEVVLGNRLESVCVDGDLDAHLKALEIFGDGDLSLIQRGGDSGRGAPNRLGLPLLSAKVSDSAGAADLLRGVYAVDSLPGAVELRRRLEPGESAVTPAGIWIGPGWARIAPGKPDDAGVLAREQEIKALAEAFAERETEVANLELEHGATESALSEAEADFAEAQGALSESHQQQGDLKSELGAAQARLEQAQSRSASLAGELLEVRNRLAAEKEVRLTAEERLKQSTQEVQRLSGERDAWQNRRETHRKRLEEVREQWHSARDRAYEIGVKVESLRAQVTSLEEARGRNRDQVQRIEARLGELDEQLSVMEQPQREAKQRLDAELAARSEVEQTLKSARAQVESLESEVRDSDRARHQIEERVTAERDALSELKLKSQEAVVRRRTVEEQFAQSGNELKALLADIGEEASESEWREKLEAMDRRINRLGPINLAAIDEYEQQFERKQYLDAQFADLEEALTTLTAAIQKIDRETRARFKETYEKVNKGLSELFPRLFGGGSAHLQLTGDDLLSTGVSVMARPPGKRNTSIQLLSGGEKALTAVALVFAIFQMNPAPFCLLDEVDAPLDDSNVMRFCELVRDMSEQIQFVLVTHNKITMELSQQLIGVTMNEPGVSRLVAVDIDEAVELAAV